MTFTVTMLQDEDGTFVVECPAIPGCVSQGTTGQEARANIGDAIRQCLAVRHELPAFDRSSPAPLITGAKRRSTI